MATPSRNDSSSSDEGDGIFCFIDKTEQHYNKDCKYNKFKTVLGGRQVYVWLRSCFCDRWTSYDIRQGVRNLHPEEGKDIHFNNECRWRRTAKGNHWELRRKCPKQCTAQFSHSFFGNVTYPRFDAGRNQPPSSSQQHTGQFTMNGQSMNHTFDGHQY